MNPQSKCSCSRERLCAPKSVLHTVQGSAGAHKLFCYALKLQMKLQRQQPYLRGIPTSRTLNKLFITFQLMEEQLHGLFENQARALLCMLDLLTVPHVPNFVEICHIDKINHFKELQQRSLKIYG